MSSYWTGKGKGEKIVLKFNKALLGDVTGNEAAFTVTGMERDPLKYGTPKARAYAIQSVERYPLTTYWQDDFSGDMEDVELGANGVRLTSSENTDYSTPAGYSLTLVTLDKTHRAATYIKTVLEGKGHTVTLYNQSEITATNLDGFDAILAPRMGDHKTSIDYLRGYIDKGIPVWAVGIGGFTAGDYTVMPAAYLGMAAKTNVTSSGNGSYLLDTDSPIASPFALPKQISIYSANTWMEMIYRANGFVGTPIANYSSADDKITVLAIEQGTNDLFGNPYGARCGFIGWMYSVGTTTLTADAQTILDRCIRWSLAERGFSEEGTYTRTLPTASLPSDPRLRFEMNEPEGTSITAEYSLDGQTWTAVEDGDLLTISGQTLHLRFTLETEDEGLSPTLQAVWIEEAEAPPDKLLITMTQAGRFNDTEGDLTISYEREKGTLTGNRPVEDFTESFTPTGLEPTPINVQGTITAGIEVEVDFIEVYYVDLGHKNTITAGITVEVDLIPVSEIPP